MSVRGTMTSRTMASANSSTEVISSISLCRPLGVGPVRLLVLVLVGEESVARSPTLTATTSSGDSR